MKHPETVLLSSYPAGSVYRRETPSFNLRLFIRNHWQWPALIVGAVVVGGGIVLAPLTTILSVLWIVGMLFCWSLCRAAARADAAFPCSHAADSAYGLEDVASGYGVIRCRCGKNRQIVRLK